MNIKTDTATLETAFKQWNFGDLKDVNRGEQIDEFIKSKTQNDPDRYFVYLRELYTLFMAGYITGKQEERAKHKPQ